MGGSGSSPAKVAAEEQQQLVGPPVRGIVANPGIFDGEHGVEERVNPGTPSSFYNNTGLISGLQCAGWVWTFLMWPISASVFLTIFALQACAPCWYCCLGNSWCMKPSQVSYIHALYVMQQTLIDSCWGYLCCCSAWWLKLEPGITFATVLLATPPKFLFDESRDKPFLMRFDDYVKLKESTFPPFSGRYRAIDGGGNQHKYPFLGQGRRGYAMNEPYMVLSPSSMPDPETISRALQIRTSFKQSPFFQNAIASWFANVAIHDFFRSATGKDTKYTNGIEKPWVNLHSGYLDLQVLYGWNADLARSCRSFVDGKMERVAENRFDGAKLPETKAIVEMLRREHNYVCDQLVARYPYQFTTDEEIYQQARLIMGGVFINVILRQYGDQMFGEDAPDGRGFAELRQKFGWWPACLGSYQTVGNQPTFNFNLIYRWHTSIPAEWSAADVPPDKTDDDLRKIFTDAYKWKSGGYGPRNMPEDLFMLGGRNVSVPAASIKQGRINGAPRLNDFRRRFTFPYGSFEDLTGDTEVAGVLRQFYNSVEDVELAVGCQVERTMTGGWCLGQTVGMAILADAFNSIRQDRFYTTDFTPELYTEWGYNHAKTCILTDILNRHLNMGLPRDVMLARVPEWKGSATWSEMAGWPCSCGSFNERGWPILG